MRLRCGGDGDDALVVTLGPQLRLKKNTFQGLVVQLSGPSASSFVANTSTLLDNLKRVPRLRKFQHFPHALRVRRVAVGSNRGDGPESDELARSKTCYRTPTDPSVLETWEDDGESGVGDRLLHLLQRWQVENVAVLVARQDDSLCGRLIGAELFKLMIEAAKLALEQYYMENIKPSDAAKIELMEAVPANVPGGPYQPLSARQPEAMSPHQPAVCLMTSDTIPSWPAKHHPTSDGGGKKGVRLGRVNHFLHHRTSNAKATSKPSGTAAAQDNNSNNNANPLSVGRNSQLQPEDESNSDDTDVTHASGGIEWLKISRDELLKLKSIRVPVKELHYLFMCIVILLEKPPKQSLKAKPTAKQQEEFTPANFSWMRCREILHQSYYWSERLRDLRGSKLDKAQVTALRAIFQEPSVNEPALMRISVASVKIYSWLQRLLDEYDELELGLHDQRPQEIPIETCAPSSPVKSPSLPTPSPSKQTRQKLQPRPPTMPLQSRDKEEQQLAKDFFASHSNKTKIVDKGRLFNHASR